VATNKLATTNRPAMTRVNLLGSKTPEATRRAQTRREPSGKIIRGAKKSLVGHIGCSMYHFTGCVTFTHASLFAL
jgi:hypothetical protein